MSVKETNESEPLMKHRKGMVEVEKGESLAPEQVQKMLAYCLDGLRCKGGVNLTQAFMWNVGTCYSNAKGAVQVVILQESEYRGRVQGRIIS